MCGRYSLTSPPEAVRQLFGYRGQPNFPPRYNIAPTQPVPVVRLVEGQAAFSLMRWGLIPSWCKDPAALPTLINARAETAAGKAAFRAPMRRRRCLMPADGFYEWQKTAKKQKVPHFVRRQDGQPFAFAGLWETWVDPDGGEIDTAAILTVSASRALADLHERMPVVVLPKDFRRWLDADAYLPEEVADVLGPAPEDFFQAYPVSTRVNAVVNDDAAIQEPLADAATPPAEPADAGGKTNRKKGTGQMSLF